MVDTQNTDTVLSTAASGAGAVCDQILARLLTLHPKIIDLSLDRVHDLLDALGNPEKALPPVVHVAGTNGKGSIIAILRSLLEASGKAVHVHISPHLIRFNERIRLAGEVISDEALQALLTECETANEGTPITFFEITTGAAVLAFSRNPADVLLLETGLGGRLDATNVVARPLLTAITPISLDHQQFLGNSIAEIAGEKAGILKSGVPCVIGKQPAEALTVLQAKAEELDAPLFIQGKDWDVADHADGFVLHSGMKSTRHPKPALVGKHQLWNAGQALMCLKTMNGFDATDAQLSQGLNNASWPARLQQLTQGPLTEWLPLGWELWLDGGHNGAAGEMIAAHATQAWPDRPLHLICGMLNSKDPTAFLTPFAGHVATFHGLAIPSEENSLRADEIADAGKQVGISETAIASSVENALAQIVSKSADPARVLICGSLYLAGTVLSKNG